LPGDLVGGDPGRSELREDEEAMGDDPGESGVFDPTHELFGPESPLAGGTPDVDPFRIQNEDPGVKAVKFAAQAVEA